jgi:hypothetical protein
VCGPSGREKGKGQLTVRRRGSEQSIDSQPDVCGVAAMKNSLSIVAEISSELRDKSEKIDGRRLLRSITPLLLGSLIAFFVLGWSVTFLKLAAAHEEEEFKKFPLKVNVLKPIAVDDNLRANIERMVKQANTILKQQVDIQVDFDKDKNINDDVSDTGNNDGNVSRQEGDRLFGAGIKELNEKFKQKGYKLYIANDFTFTVMDKRRNAVTPIGTSTTIIPVTIMKKSVLEDQSLVNTLAHEICHAFGLPELNVVNNLMNPLTPGTELNAAQKRRCKDGAERWAKSKKRRDNPMVVPVDTKHGSWSDEPDDVTKSHIDLFIGSLFAEVPAADLEVSIVLSGVHASGTDIDSQFEIFFNSDNNIDTGSTFGSFGGIDKILRITLTGQFPFTPPVGIMTAEVFDVDSDSSTVLEPGQVARISTVFDDFETGDPPTSEAFDAIEQSLPLSFLGTLADQVPIGIRAMDRNTEEFDETFFVFEFNPPPGPLLDMSPLFGQVGDTVNVEGTNFSPFSQVRILVDDTEVLITTTLADGSFLASFTFPDLPADNYFVTARDDTGLFDFSVLTIP